MTTKALLCVSLLAMTTSLAQAKDIVIHAGRLIDPATHTDRQKVSIRIHDDRITGIESGFIMGDGADLIELGDKTVLPGLIDCHVHILQSRHSGDPIRNAVTRTAFDDEIDGVNNARATLLAGFTTVRDVGGDIRALSALKKAVNAGSVPGPRLWISGNALGPSDGHGDPLNGLNEEIFHPNGPTDVVDSPEEARKAVRILKRQGADLIKIMPSGGVMSIGDDPALQLMNDDEIKAVVETAHALGMKVAAHAHGHQAINHAIELGVDSIEHGTYGAEDSYKLYKTHGTYLVPTTLVGARVVETAKNHPESLNPSTAAKALVVGPIQLKDAHDAYAAGVKMAFGTDTFGLSAHGDNAQEFAILVSQGVTPSDAIAMATMNAADLIGDSKDIGSVSVGHYADLIAVDSDPLKNVKVLEDVGFVMKGGVVYKRDHKPVG